MPVGVRLADVRPVVPVRLTTMLASADGSMDVPSRIVVGIDGSPGARRALEQAIVEAGFRDGAQIEAVLAYPSLLRDLGLELGAMPVPHDVVEAQALERLHAALRGVPRDVPIDPIAVEGPAARVLVEASRGADMLVVGTRGRGGFRSMLLGSTSHQVVSHAHCPVLVVPPHDDEPDQG